MNKKIQFNEAEYNGEVNTNNQPHGKGIMKFNNGEIYEGLFDNGVRHGKGIYFWPDGKKYDGNFMKGEFSGRAIFSSIDNSYEGMFYKGQKNGNGKMVFGNGDFKEGVWKNNDFVEGKVIYSYENKNGLWKYEGQYKIGKRNGYGKLYKNNSLVFDGEFIDDEFGEGNHNVDVKLEDGTKITGDIKNGNGRKELPDGDYYEGTWSNWKFVEGKVRETNNKGYVYEGFYKNGNRNGYGKLIEPSGKLMYEGEFRNGSTLEDLNDKINKIKKFASENSFSENQGFFASLFGKKDDKSEEFYQNIIIDNLKSGKLKDAIQNFIYYYIKYIPIAKNNEDLFSQLLVKIKNDNRFNFAYKELVGIIHDHSSDLIKELFWDETYEQAIDFLKNERIIKKSSGKDFIGDKSVKYEIVASENAKAYFELKKKSFQLYLKLGLKNEVKNQKISYAISVIENTESEWLGWANYRKNNPVSTPQPASSETKNVEKKDTSIEKKKMETNKNNTIKTSVNEVKEEVSTYGRKMKDGMYGAEETAQQGFVSEPSCLKCGKKMKQGAKAIVTFSKIDWGTRVNRKQFCTWKCAEAYHN